MFFYSARFLFLTLVVVLAEYRVWRRLWSGGPLDKISSLKRLMNALITIPLCSRSREVLLLDYILLRLYFIEYEPQPRICLSCYTIIMNFVLYVAPPLLRQQPWLLHRSLPNPYLGIAYHTPVTKDREKVERNRP